jgi:hypothetical protein
VLGAREAEVLELRWVDVHGVAYADIVLRFADGVVAPTRIGRESIPTDLEVGERVMVSEAVNVVVQIRRS